ncbi:MAG: biopolymer transporter ExbD [Flavobacteriales bacterium]|jgi:biopolymer transport protein ExbD|nr:biopolymer transporter ExbD [Flavobacteriales bacterium]MCB9205315.1 biopolymer transporter ExbD [Flavobacteriales bacterium]
MQIRKKKQKEVPPVSTASLPDIVFMLLFFFMVTTVMRETSLKVTHVIPKAKEVAKLERKSLVAYIHIGPPLKPLQSIYGTEPRIQLDDAFATPKDIPTFVESVKSQTNEAEVPLLTYSLKVDKDTKMGIVVDVKQELRKAQALKINYSTTKIVDKSKL